MLSPTSPAPRLHPLVRYLLACLLVLSALAFSLALQAPFDNPFWFFFAIAVILCTWYFGRGPGWLAVGLSTIAVLYYFIPPYRSFHLNLVDVPFFVTFVLCQMVANWLISWRRETEDSLRRARDELETRVNERTAELKNANDALVKQMAEQRRTEEALQTARAELARVARITTIGELTASIAHEVNQPLAAVVANGDACVAWLSHRSPDLTEARAAAERMIQGATRASEVIARIRSLINKKAPEKARVQINEIIAGTAALVERQASRNHASVDMELAANLPPIWGDSIQLQQVILNLLINGIEAMTTVTDRPRRLLIRTESDAGQVRVAVQDSGIGIAPEAMARLFEPFFTTRSDGIGMGLAISRSIVEAHGGRLWAESNPAHGAIFQFTLQAAEGTRE